MQASLLTYNNAVLADWNVIMTYYLRENLLSGPILSPRRPTINEFFLSSYTMSIYVGCEIGCSYCDGWVYNPRPLNETIYVPLNLPQLLAEELTRVNRGDLIAITALSDPYQPAEQTYRITRQVLHVLADAEQPCLILTKGLGIVDDIPLLQRMNERSLAIVMTTLVTMDRQIAERLEAKAPPTHLRLEMLATLKRAGIPVGVAMVPIIPYVNDTNTATRALLRACAEIGVDFAIWDYLNIPDERHRMRINESLGRIATYLPSYHRDIYGSESLPSIRYRAERDAELLARWDGMNIEARAPHRLFANRLTPCNEAALLLKHMAFRDMAHGRMKMAAMHRQLADQVYAGDIQTELLERSPLSSTLQPILQRTH